MNVCAPDGILHAIGGGYVIRWIAILTAMTILAANSAQTSTQVPAVDSSAQAAADRLFQGMTSPADPGLAVLVKRNGHVVLERNYGVRDLRSKTPIDANTDFRLASCTKQFTAMGIMLLVHDGKLLYDETLAELFPDFPAYGRAITIRELLTHTSGLPDYETLMEKDKAHTWTDKNQISDEEVLRLLESAKSGDFAPGTRWAYSNSGYVLLGVIISRASGKSYGEFLHERIFAPLKMENTLAFVNNKNEVPNRAYGHSRENGVFVQTDQSSTSATLGDGGVYSNLNDLSKWDDALRNRTLLSEAEMRVALTPGTLASGGATRWPQESGDDNLHPGEPVEYGFGWFLDPYRDHQRMWHYGSTMGFRTAIERFPTDELTVVILANRSDLDVDKLALQTAELYLKK